MIQGLLRTARMALVAVGVLAFGLGPVAGVILDRWVGC